MSCRLPVLIIASEKYGNGSASDKAMKRPRDAIHEHGYETTLATTPEDGLAIVVSDPVFGCVFLDWDLPGGSHFCEHAAEDILKPSALGTKTFQFFLLRKKHRLATCLQKSLRKYMNMFTCTRIRQPLLQVGWTLLFDATMKPFFHHISES